MSKGFKARAAGIASAAAVAASMASSMPTVFYAGAAMSSDPSYTFLNSYYDQLDDVSKEVYDTIYETYKDGPIKESIVIHSTKIYDDVYMTFDGEVGANYKKMAEAMFSQADFDDAFEAVTLDHPEMYWLSSNVPSIGCGGSFSENQKVVGNKFVFEYYHYDYTLEFKDIDETIDYKTPMDNAVEKAKEKIGDSGSTYLNIKAIHDYICDNLVYNDDAATYPSVYNDFQLNQYQSAYSAFYQCNGDEEPMTVCAGYARGFKVLCDSYNIPCLVIPGKSCYGGNHMWNLVKVGDSWYGIDPTWDDGNPGDAKDIYYDFFLVGSQTSTDGRTFENSHIPEPNYVPYEGATPIPSNPIVFPELSEQKYNAAEHGISLTSMTSDMSMSSIAKLSVKGNRTSFYNGDSVTVSAENKAGYRFVGWYPNSPAGYGGDVLSTDLEYTFTVGNTATALVAVYEPVSAFTITVSSDSGKVSAIAKDQTPVFGNGEKITCYAGTEITAKAEGDNFAYWVNDNGIIVSRSAEYTFKAASSANIKAVYEEHSDGETMVSFLTGYNQLLSQTSCTDGSVPAIPKAPNKLNCTFAGWSVNGGKAVSPDELSSALKTAIANAVKNNSSVSVKAVFNTVDTSYTIQVSGGNGGGSFKANDTVTVKADAPEDGMAFAYWSLGDKIVSRNAEYTFFAVTNMRLTANYVKAGSAEAKASGIASIMNTVCDKDSNKITVIGGFSVPEGCTIETAGVLGTSKTLSDSEFKVGNADLASSSNISSNEYRFDRIVNISAGNENKSFSFRAYLVYTDENGDVITVYSDPVTVSLNGGVK